MDVKITINIMYMYLQKYETWRSSEKKETDLNTESMYILILNSIIST